MFYKYVWIYENGAKELKSRPKRVFFSSPRKASEMSQAWSHVFLNLRHSAEHFDLAISGTGRPQENRIFRFLKIHKKKRF